MGGRGLNSEEHGGLEIRKQRFECCWEVEYDEKREVAAGLVNMKDAGDVRSIAVGGMKGGATLEWAEENGSEDTEPVCES